MFSSLPPGHIFNIGLPQKIGYFNKKNFQGTHTKNFALIQNRVILHLMKYAGLLLSYEKEGEMKFDLWNTPVVYGVAVYLIVMYHIITTMMNNFRAFMEEDCDSKCQTFQIVVFILSLQTILIPVSFWAPMAGFINYFQNWYQFQLLYRDYSKKEITINIKRMMKKMAYVVILVSLFICAIICHCFYIKNLSFDIFLTYFLICFFINTSILFWFCQCTLIQVAAKLLRRFFEQLILSTGKSPQDVIMVSFEMWIALNNIVKCLTKNFSFLITSLCFCCFLSTLITTHCFVSQIFLSSKHKPDGYFTFMNLVLSIWMFILQYILNNSSYNTTKQVDFRKWVVTLNLNSLDENLQNQILELLSYFENQKPQIGLFGFEFLSREFIITIFSTLITYLIIILQFQNSGVHSSSNLSNFKCTNVTSYQ